MSTLTMNKTVAYQNYLREYLTKIDHIEHLFFAENPGSLDQYIYNITNVKPQSPYFTAIKNAFGITGRTKKDVLDTMASKGILVWDIFHISNRCKKHENCDCYCNVITPGITIRSNKKKETGNTPTRNLMIKKGCTLHAFKSSIDILNNYCLKKGKKINTQCNVYFLMPQLTSLPIFNHYNKCNSEKLILGYNDENRHDIAPKLRLANNLFYKDNCNVIFPRHLINVIGGSNTPRQELIKHASNNQN